MTCRKQQMLSEPIKRYLIQCVARSGLQPEQLLNELELCDRFSVSRRTAHKAVDDLLTIGYISHLPGRRGIFTNPDYAGHVPYSVGILGDYGNCSSVNCGDTTILGSFLNRISRYKCMTTFMTLNRAPEEADLELQIDGVDAVFWIKPDKEYLPAIERLIQGKFPMVVLGNLKNSHYEMPASNGFSIDFPQGGKQRAMFFQQQGCRHVLYCGIGGQSYESFCQTMGGLPEHHHLPDVKALSRLPGILQREPIDGVVCDGMNNQHHQVLKILSNLPNCADIKVLLAIGLDLEEMHQAYPRLNLYSLCATTDYATLEKIGKDAALQLGRMLTRHCGYHFNNRFYCWKHKPASIGNA